MEKLTKKSLIEKLSNLTGIPQSDSGKMTDLFFKTVKDSIRSGRRVELRGFGVFERFESRKKYGRDIKKNIKKLISKKYRLKFTPSEVIINKINE